jgi:hypothetical protein
MALDAGADLLCLSNNGKDYDPGIVPKVVFTIYNLIAEGAVTTDRIYQSALRVRELKENLSKSSR